MKVWLSVLPLQFLSTGIVLRMMGNVLICWLILSLLFLSLLPLNFSQPLAIYRILPSEMTVLLKWEYMAATTRNYASAKYKKSKTEEKGPIKKLFTLKTRNSR